MRLFPYRLQIYLFLLRQQNDNSFFRVAIELKKLIRHLYPTNHKGFAKRSLQFNIFIFTPLCRYFHYFLASLYSRTA